MKKLFATLKRKVKTNEDEIYKATIDTEDINLLDFLASIEPHMALWDKSC